MAKSEPESEGRISFKEPVPVTTILNPPAGTCPDPPATPATAL